MGFRRSNKAQPEAQPDSMADESLRPKVEWKPTTQELMIMIVLSVISFMVSLDATIIVTSLSSIVEDLKGTTTQGIWVGTAYLLSTAVAMPFLASVSNIFGRPTLLVFSVALFSVGTVICCTSHSIGQLLAGRAVQGIGGGGIVVISLVTFTDIVPLRQRPKWYGTVQGAWALGTCIGPIAGGAIAQKTTWRWIFYIMLPICGFGLVAIPLLLTIRPRVATMGQRLRRVDWVGSLLFMGSATSFLIAISWGGTQFAWSSAATLAPLIVGAAGLVATALWERFGAAEPLLQHGLFGSVSGVAVYACSAAQGLLLFGQLYYGPFYFMAVLAYTPLHTGVALLPVMLTLVPASIVAGALITRTSSYRWPMWVGWAVCTIACGLMTMWDTSTPVAAWAAALVVLGLGHGAVLNAQNFAAQAICGAGDEAAAAAAYAFMRHFGTALGVGIGGSAFQNFMARGLDGAPEALSAWAANAEGWLPLLLAMDPASPERATILAGYVDGFRGVFRVYLAISGAAMLASLLVGQYDMNKDLVSEHQLRENKLSVIIDARLGRSSRMPAGAAALAAAVAGLSAVDEEQGAAAGGEEERDVKQHVVEDAEMMPASDASSRTEVEVGDSPQVVLKAKEGSEDEETAAVADTPPKSSVDGDADENHHEGSRPATASATGTGTGTGTTTPRASTEGTDHETSGVLASVGAPTES